MNWVQLKKEISADIFFQNTLPKFGLGNINYDLHPFINFNFSLAYQTIYKNNNDNRLAVIIPYKSDMAFWIAFLLSIESLHRKNPIKTGENTKMIQGKRYKSEYGIGEYIGQKIIEEKVFLSFDYAGDKKQQPARINIPKERCINYEPTTEKITKYIKPIQTDKKLDISYSHKNIILISDIKHYREFQVTQLHKAPDTFKNIAKINNDGIIKSEHPNLPISILISKHIANAKEYLDKETDKTEAIIINGYKKLIKGHYELSQIHDKNIPVIITADYSESDNYDLYHSLKDKGYKFWIWSKKLIKDGEFSLEHSNSYRLGFHDINLKLFTTSSIKVKRLSCKELSDIIKKFNDVQNMIPNNLTLNHYCYMFIRLLKEIALISKFLKISENEEIKAGFVKKLSEIKDGFLKEKTNFDKNTEFQINLLCVELENLLTSDEKNADAKVVLEEISEISHDVNVDLILYYPEYKKYLAPYISMHCIEYNQILKKSIGGNNILIVPLWGGKEKMINIFNANLYKEIRLILYDFEEKWYNRCRNEIKKIFSELNDAKKICETIKNEKDESYDFLKETQIREDHDISQYIEDPEEKNNNLFRENIKKYRNDSSSQYPSVSAKYIEFSQDKYGFFSEGHKVICIMDIDDEDDQEDNNINISYILDLHEGDYAVFPETDKDIIREWVDREINQNNLKHLEEKAYIWKECLNELYMKHGTNTENLFKFSKESNIFERLFLNDPPENKTKYLINGKSYLINNWINDENMIAPQDFENVKSIIKASGKDFDESEYEKMHDAIKEIRNAHNTAGRKLLKKLREKLHIKSGDINEVEEGLFRIENFGTIYIVRVERIDADFIEVERNKINRLIARYS